MQGEEKNVDTIEIHTVPQEEFLELLKKILEEDTEILERLAGQ